MEPAQPTSIPLSLLAIVGLVLANAFFVATEFALVRSRVTRLDELIRAGDRKAILARRAIQSLARSISATQLGITLASLGLGWIGEPALAHLIDGWFRGLPGALATIATHSVATLIAFAIISCLHIILGEEERLHSPEELRMLVEQSEEGGSLHKQDARLLEGVFEFSEKTAQEVMTPRTDMIALPADLTVEQAADEVAKEKRSRYPVYTDSLDEIVGVVHAKDILSGVLADPAQPLRTIMRPPLFVPGTREVEDVLADMKRLKVHLAVVLDEYGGTAGLVTMEDLLEEIVGPIYDEYDLQEGPPATSPGGIVLDGAMPITEFNTEYEAELSDADYTTLGSYLFGPLGRLPKTGDRVSAGPFVFEVLEMEGRRVKAIRLHQTKAEEAGKSVK